MPVEFEDVPPHVGADAPPFVRRTANALSGPFADFTSRHDDAELRPVLANCKRVAVEAGDALAPRAEDGTVSLADVAALAGAAPDELVGAYDAGPDLGATRVGPRDLALAAYSSQVTGWPDAAAERSDVDPAAFATLHRSVAGFARRRDRERERAGGENRLVDVLGGRARDRDDAGVRARDGTRGSERNR